MSIRQLISILESCVFFFINAHIFTYVLFYFQLPHFAKEGSHPSHSPPLTSFGMCIHSVWNWHYNQSPRTNGCIWLNQFMDPRCSSQRTSWWPAMTNWISCCHILKEYSSRMPNISRLANTGNISVPDSISWGAICLCVRNSHPFWLQLLVLLSPKATCSTLCCWDIS